MKVQRFFIGLTTLLILAGCGDDDTTEEVLAPSGITSTVLCGISEAGTQQLVYDNLDPTTGTTTAVDESLAFNYAWNCAGTDRVLTGNGVPNHVVTGGEFASKISTQTVTFTFPMDPEVGTTVSTIKEPGYAINGVKFDPATAGTCPDAATVITDCDPGAGSDTWQMVALPGATSPWIFGFGTDTSNAHVQPGGLYHYHGIPEELVPVLNTSSATSMTLVGWAKDGFPIYARYGYTTATDSSSALKIVTSSFKTKDTPEANRPDIADIPMGHFEQDWEYVEGLGDLDECNGRTGVTPEFPDGIYHYYMTESYPFIQRCVSGSVADDAGGPGGGGGGPPEGGGPPPE